MVYSTRSTRGTLVSYITSWTNYSQLAVWKIILYYFLAEYLVDRGCLIGIIQNTQTSKLASSAPTVPIPQNLEILDRKTINYQSI